MHDLINWNLEFINSRSRPVIVVYEYLFTDAHGKMYLRGQQVDDLETNVEPEIRLVEVDFCQFYNKMRIIDLIKNWIPYKSSFCCFMIYLGNFYYNAEKHTNKKVNNICDRVISVVNRTKLKGFKVDEYSSPMKFS